MPKGKGQTLATAGKVVAAATAFKRGGARQHDKKLANQHGPFLDTSLEVDIRRNGCANLGLLNRAAVKPFQGHLSRRLWDEDESVRLAAAKAIGLIGAGAAASQAARLGSRLAFADKHSRDTLARSLIKMGPEGARALAKNLDHSSADVRAVAAEALGCMGMASAADHLPALEALAQDKNEVVRAAALTSLGWMGEEQAASAAVTSEPSTPSQSAPLNSSTGVAGAPAPRSDLVAEKQAATLSQWLHESDPSLRLTAARAMGRLKPAAAAPYAEEVRARFEKSTVEATIPLTLWPPYREEKPSCSTEDDDNPLMQYAGDVHCGRDSRRPVAAFEVWRERHKDRREAVEALTSMSEVGALFLASELSNGDARVRVTALEALGSMGDGAAEQAHCVADRFNDEDPIIRCRAAEAIVRLGEAARPYMWTLAGLVYDEDAGVRRTVGEVLNAYNGGPISPEVLQGYMLDHQAAEDAIREAEEAEEEAAAFALAAELISQNAPVQAYNSDLTDTISAGIDSDPVVGPFALADDRS